MAHVFGVQEALEALGGVEALQDVTLVLGPDLVPNPLHPLLHPPLLVGLLDVHVFDADGLAVGVPEQVEDLP